MSNETSQETWNATHAQLLKSVADAQAKLLAAQNETNDRLEVLGQRLTALTVSAAALNGNHSGLKGQLDDLAISCTGLSGRVDAIGAILAELLVKPRRRILDPSIARAKRNRTKRRR